MVQQTRGSSFKLCVPQAPNHISRLSVLRASQLSTLLVSAIASRELVQARGIPSFRGLMRLFVSYGLFAERFLA